VSPPSFRCPLELALALLLLVVVGVLCSALPPWKQQNAGSRRHTDGIDAHVTCFALCLARTYREYSTILFCFKIHGIIIFFCNSYLALCFNVLCILSLTYRFTYLR
jgi:nicotinamide riboside transporter PnuC